MQSESLVVPLLLKDKTQESVSIEQSCVASSPTKLLSWGLDDAYREADKGAPMLGAALGCEDGSVYLFSADFSRTRAGTIDLPSGKQVVSSHVALESQVPSTPTSLKSPPGSRRTSQSLYAPHPLSQPTRSRVTSSVFKASAEAPKNHVDFDDEKERLGDMIKNGPPLKEKSVIDGLRASYAVAGLGFAKDDPKMNGANSGSQQGSKEISFSGSAPATPRDSSTPPSRSSLSSVPTADQLLPAADSDIGKRSGLPLHLTLRSHVFPPQLGAGHGVISLQRLSSETFVFLQESGIITVISIQSGVCLALLDLEEGPHLHPPPPPSPSTFTMTAASHTIWTWKYLQVAKTPESTILLAVACDQSSPKNEEDAESRTRVAVLQLQEPETFLESGTSARHAALQKVGEWIMFGSPETIGLLSEDTTMSPSLLYVSPAPSSKIVSHSLQIVPPAFAIAAPASLQPSPEALSSISSAPANPPTSTSLPNISGLIPNPFKHKNSGIEDNKAEKAIVTVPGRVVLGPQATLGIVPVLEGNSYIKGIHVWKTGEATQGVLWNDTNFAVFEDRDTGSNTQLCASMPHRDLVFIEKFGKNMFVLYQKRRVDVYRVSASQESSTPTLERVSSRMFNKHFKVGTAISPSLLLCSRPRINSDGTPSHMLAYMPIPPVGPKAASERKVQNDQFKVRNAWSPPEKLSVKEDRQVTSLLPLEIELIILGYNDGSIGRSSLSDLLTIGWPEPCKNNAGINGLIISLHSIKNERTNERFVIGGIDDGGIAVWDLSTLQLKARWTIFTEPLRTVISLKDETIGRLQGSIICVSEDGTLAMIAVDGLEFLHLIPGSAARLTRICLGEDNLLLMYADEMARLWDVKTQVLWRSMTKKTADELLRQGEWFQADVGPKMHEVYGTSLAPMQGCFSSYDAASTVLLDIRALNDLIHPLPLSHLFRDPRREDSGNRIRDQDPVEFSSSSQRASRRLKFLKALLGSFLSFGLDDTTDEICREKLGIAPSLAVIGLFSNDSATKVLSSANAREIWQISPEHTASRLLALVTVLRGLLAFDECESHANQVIAFYATSLHDAVGPLWQAPSLSFLARYWFHTSSEIRLAARALFGAAADRLSDRDTIQLVEHWQHELPCLQPNAEKQSAYSALALLIAGNVAIERYTVLSASTLTDIAKSITLYLHDETCPHRALAIDLCSRGFQIWQHYVDAMEVLRALFALSTSPDKERNVGPQARLAVLQIASSNTPLFMTTLSLDILHPQSVQKRKSIMQLVAFLIRKKPLVLYPNLPRLVEAVVKSLDPSSSGDRDAVLEDATEILGQVVKTYPSVDFHMPSQRLCVGTGEGAVIMYDLKTATRLYVLEGHKKRLDACSFAPDGRRLVTVSLEESLVRVWKVGSSITSLFMPGAPPRQGHAGSEPFKTLNFNVGNEAHMTVAGILELVQFEWPADRTARLKIRDSTFTFNT